MSSNPLYARSNEGEIDDMGTLSSRKIALELIQDARATLADARRLLELEPSEELFKICVRLAECEGVLMDVLLEEGRR